MSFFDALVVYWDAYSDECYADSITRMVLSNSDFEYICAVHGCLEVHRLMEKKTIHEEPTFEGFMEWIRKRNKQ